MDNTVEHRENETLRLARLAVLAFGPLLTLHLLDRFASGYATFEAASAEFAAVVLWSPLFLSIPALLLQHERDRALPEMRPWFRRGLHLVPALLARGSRVRTEMLVSLTAWVIMLLLVADSVVGVGGRLLG